MPFGLPNQAAGGQQPAPSATQGTKILKTTVVDLIPKSREAFQLLSREQAPVSP
jgi:hypothetical protein